MSSEEFKALCEEKIRAYLNAPLGAEYDVYTIWKDYWTVGASMDSVQSTENQKGIFGTTYNSKYFDFTYNGIENKLYMNVYDVTDTEIYDLSQTTTPNDGE